MIIEVLIGSSVSAIAGFFIAKKLDDAKYDVFVAQAQAKAKVIEHEAEMLLKNAKNEIAEKELEIKKQYEAEFMKIQNEFDKKYYYSLYPSKNSKIISKYDDEKIDELVEKLGENLVLISGDFWGIQNFIFDSLTSNKASKIMRSRSAMVQLITFVVTEIVKEEFKESDTLLFGAGKFMILAKDEENVVSKIEGIQKELDKFFLQNFFGQNGMILSYAKTSKENILNQHSEKMKEELLNLGNDNELKKLNKFNIQNIDDEDICLDIFKNATSDDEICSFCKKRVGTSLLDNEKVCKICENQVNLGKYLTTKELVKIYSSNKKEED
jgi:CRISPR-associated protein Cas10/Csm1 subtype III-A